MPDNLKDDILEHVDIVEVVGERVSLTRKGREFVGLCPFHNDKSPSLNVSPAKRIFKCFACGAGGDVIKFVQMIDGVSFRAALEQLARRAGLDVRQSSPDDQRRAQARDQLRRIMEWAAQHFRRNLTESAAGRTALDYARGRGLSDEIMARFGLGLAVDGWSDVLDAGRRAGLAPQALVDAGLLATNENGRTYDRFRNRLIFPICDVWGKPIAFGGRTLGDDPAKYLNSPEGALFNKSRVLYALGPARDSIQRLGRAIVVEGYLDAILLHQAGVTETVATLGTALTDNHAKTLRPLAEQVFMCFDGDEAGERAADRAVEVAIRQGIDVRVVILPGGQDPADYVLSHGAEGFAEVLSTAQSALQFKWQQMVRAIEHGQRRSRKATVEAFLAFVAQAGEAGGLDPIEQGLLVSQLSELIQVPAPQVYELLGRAREALRRRRPGDEPAAETPEALDAYAAAVEDVPPALVAVVEELFGVLLADAQWFAELDEAFAQAIAHSHPWQLLFDALRLAIDEHGDYTREEIIAHCDEDIVLTLIHRACRRLNAAPGDAERVFRAAYERLRQELDTIRAADLRGQLQNGAPDAADRAFAALVEISRRRKGFLPA